MTTIVLGSILEILLIDVIAISIISSYAIRRYSKRVYQDNLGFAMMFSLSLSICSLVILFPLVGISLGALFNPIMFAAVIFFSIGISKLVIREGHYPVNGQKPTA